MADHAESRSSLMEANLQEADELLSGLMREAIGMEGFKVEQEEDAPKACNLPEATTQPLQEAKTVAATPAPGAEGSEAAVPDTERAESPPLPEPAKPTPTPPWRRAQSSACVVSSQSPPAAAEEPATPRRKEEVGDGARGAARGGR